MSNIQYGQVTELMKDATFDDHYVRHIVAMSTQGLQGKEEIASELAWRDAQIEELTPKAMELEILRTRLSYTEAENDRFRVMLTEAVDYLNTGDDITSIGRGSAFHEQWKVEKPVMDRETYTTALDLINQIDIKQKEAVAAIANVKQSLGFSDYE